MMPMKPKPYHSIGLVLLYVHHNHSMNRNKMLLNTFLVHGMVSILIHSIQLLPRIVHAFPIYLDINV